MRQRAMFAILAVVIGAFAAAQVSYKFADWAESPVKHLMTKEEMRQWKAIKSDQDAAAFVDLFWAKRDPTPATPRNEFRDEFDKRVALADQEFSGHIRGAMSDPG